MFPATALYRSYKIQAIGIRRLKISNHTSSLRHFRLMSSSTKRRISQEVISDSEPERETLRRRVKEINRSQKALAKLPISGIIDLTDSESADSTTTDNKSIQVTPQTPVDTPATSTGQGNKSLLVIGSPKRTTIPDVEGNEEDPHTNNPDTLNVDSDDSKDGVIEMQMKLGKYIYSKTTTISDPKAHNNVFTRKGVTRDIVSDLKKGKARQSELGQAIHAMDAYLDSSSQSILKMKKCVSCDVAWTTRKTLKHKTAHLRKCARKNLLSCETLTVRIRQELERHSIPSEQETMGTSLDKRKSKSIEKTLLDGVVEANGVSHVNRRKKDTNASVRTISETRSRILSKAESLLTDPTKTSADKERSLQNPCPATQAFGSSKFHSRSVLLKDDSDESNDDVQIETKEPPLTQAFAKSKMVSNDVQRSSLFDADDQLNKDFREPLPPSPVDDLTHSYENISILDDECDADDALLVFDPGDSGPQSKLLYPNHNYSIGNCTNTITGDHSDISAKTRRTGRKNKVVLEDDDLFAMLEARVRSNKFLYSRILRFEPIPFKNFSSLIDDQNMSKAVKTQKLRRFLDLQAIHYYGMV